MLITKSVFRPKCCLMWYESMCDWFSCQPFGWTSQNWFFQKISIFSLSCVALEDGLWGCGTSILSCVGGWCILVRRHQRWLSETSCRLRPSWSWSFRLWPFCRFWYGLEFELRILSAHIRIVETRCKDSSDRLDWRKEGSKLRGKNFWVGAICGIAKICVSAWGSRIFRLVGKLDNVWRINVSIN